MVIREFRGLIRFGFSTPEILLLQEIAEAAMLEPSPGRTPMESLPIIHALSGRMM
jgi:hypothetical protein